jgi:uncharacterized cupredoxin-like copper-binding protein
LPTGEVELAVANRGPVAHELVVVRKRGARLPLGPDGLTVNEEKLEDQSLKVGELEPSPPGVHGLQLHLKLGTYVLFCNMAGHYLGGMHRTVVVR